MSCAARSVFTAVLTAALRQGRWAECLLVAGVLAERVPRGLGGAGAKWGPLTRGALSFSPQSSSPS